MWTLEKLKDSQLELHLVPQIGGRLMDVLFDGTSLLFSNPDLHDTMPDLANLDKLPSRASHIPFPLWGGEKTWVAPDSNWPNNAPQRTLDSGPYTLSKLGNRSVTMVSEICPDSKLQISRTVSISGPRSWSIDHRITNRGQSHTEAGIWSVAMTRKPVDYYFPKEQSQVFSTVFGNPVGSVRPHSAVAVVSCSGSSEFKVASHPSTGFAAARIQTATGNIWLLSKTKGLRPSQNYAHGNALEFYNSAHYRYAELEWHSPKATLEPEQVLEMRVKFSVQRENEHLSAWENFNYFEQSEWGNA